MQVPCSNWLAKIESLGAQGVIFDCDGTLADSGTAHFFCMQAAVREQGFEMAQSWYEARSGLDRASLFQSFKNDVAASLDLGAAIQTSIEQFDVCVEKVSPIGPTIQLLHQLSERRYPIAVVTNAERPIAAQSLRQIGVFDHLRTLVSISDGFPAKPAPQMFEHAAQLLGLLPENVVVFEDSPQGVSAAVQANMPVFLVYNVPHNLAQ